jgi:hypothetical protein
LETLLSTSLSSSSSSQQLEQIGVSNVGAMAFRYEAEPILCCVSLAAATEAEDVELISGASVSLAAAAAATAVILFADAPFVAKDASSDL